MTRASIAIGCMLVALAGAPGAVAGDRGEEQGASQRLERGQELYAEQEYGKAIRQLARVTRDPAATRAQRLAAYELIGLSNLILGREERAREAFAALLAIDPEFQLRDDSGSPKIRGFFAAVKREHEFWPAVELRHDAPAKAAAGRALAVEVRAGAGAEIIKEMVLLGRPRGERGYVVWHMRQVGDHMWRARLTPPPPPPPSPSLSPSRAAYVLEYYIEGRDIGGRAVARAGSPAAPLGLAVDAGRARRKAWHRRWYVIAGGVALAGIAGALLATSGNRSAGTLEGTLEPGPVTLTP